MIKLCEPWRNRACCRKCVYVVGVSRYSEANSYMVGVHYRMPLCVVVCVCLCVGVVWRMSVHVGTVYAHRKCLCAMDHTCALEKSGHLVGGVSLCIVE